MEEQASSVALVEDASSAECETTCAYRCASIKRPFVWLLYGVVVLYMHWSSVLCFLA